MYFVRNAGLSIVYLSGRKSPDAGGIGAYSEDDVDAVRALAEEPGIVDIFITYPSHNLPIPQFSSLISSSQFFFYLLRIFGLFGILNKMLLMNGQVGFQMELIHRIHTQQSWTLMAVIQWSRCWLQRSSPGEWWIRIGSFQLNCKLHSLDPNSIVMGNILSVDFTA